MATNVYSAQIGLVTASGDVNIIYPKTLAANVSYTNAAMTGVTSVSGALDWVATNCPTGPGLAFYVDSDGILHITYDDPEEQAG